jgi:hypothetical protein
MTTSVAINITIAIKIRSFFLFHRIPINSVRARGRKLSITSPAVECRRQRAPPLDSSYYRELDLFLPVTHLENAFLTVVAPTNIAIPESSKRRGSLFE